MRHINQFPVLKDPEVDALKLKIVMNVTENWTIARETDRDHFDRAAVAGQEWTKYPCWLANSQWSDGKGFKKMKFKGHSLYIHRASCEVFNGPVPADNLVDHLCRVRDCCQHMHLEAVTHAENILRGANENKLLREGAPPPVSAKEINPKFFDAPTIDEIKIDYARRIADGSDIKRTHCTLYSPLPEAPAGFEWQPAGGLDSCDFMLNPIRDKLPITVPAPVISDGLQQFDVAASRYPEYPHYKEHEFGVRELVPQPFSPPVFEETRNGYVPKNSSGGWRWLRSKLKAMWHWLDVEIGT